MSASQASRTTLAGARSTLHSRTRKHHSFFCGHECSRRCRETKVLVVRAEYSTDGANDLDSAHIAAAGCRRTLLAAGVVTLFSAALPTPSVQGASRPMAELELKNLQFLLRHRHFAFDAFAVPPARVSPLFG
jgi:hypothetical protein